MLKLLEYPLAFTKPGRIGKQSAWTEHIPFAFALMECHHPLLFVELGTHTGISYSAFCQAVDALALPTRCYAVDSWKGDEHALFYGEEVFREFSEFHNRHYSSFSSLMRMQFDEAVSCFGDGTIDLLHIDGCHYYESIKHDFETWLPKMSDRGVVLLHDTLVKEKDFGVGKFLEETGARYPVFEFTHCYGLGVVAVGGEVRNEPLGELFRSGQQETMVIRRYFSLLGARITLEEESRAIKEDLARRQSDLAERDARIAEKDASIAERDKLIGEKDARLQEMRRSIDEILNSWSWKMTGALRSLYRLLHGSRPGLF